MAQSWPWDSQTAVTKNFQKGIKTVTVTALTVSQQKLWKNLKIHYLNLVRKYFSNSMFSNNYRLAKN